MSQILNNLKIDIDETLEQSLSYLAPHYKTYRILHKTLDARRKSRPHFVYSVEIFSAEELPQKTEVRVEPVSFSGPPPVIVGAGPAGLFAALRLVERGIPCRLFDRGALSEKRMLGINQYWRYGRLNSDNNVCFGEGGAGLYSDGKLMTRIKSPHIAYVLDRLVQFGAPEEILYLANPHVGSDRIRRVLPPLRRFLIQNGCEYHMEEKVLELSVSSSGQTIGVKTGRANYRSDHVILATGHSADEVYDHLMQIGVSMKKKPFAVGLRVEHPQSQINKIQFRQYAEHPNLGPAQYRLSHHDRQSGVGVYSFCMCPGGYVLSSGTQPNGIVSNGMSNFQRNSPFANAAVVVTIDPRIWNDNDDLSGLKFCRQLETKAYSLVQSVGGTKQLPVQPLTAFLEGKLAPHVPSSCLSGVVATRLDQLFSEALTDRIRQGLVQFDHEMRGFISNEAQLHGVESRTSSPVQVTRDPESFQSISHPGLYPCGEGMGYAGGITSAAVDGIRVAEAIVATDKAWMNRKKTSRVPS